MKTWGTIVGVAVMELPFVVAIGYREYAIPIALAYFVVTCIIGGIAIFVSTAISEDW